MARFHHILIVLSCMGILTGCAAKQAVIKTPLNPSAAISTMTSAVALSVKAGEKGMSGRGYLIMRSPDQFRLLLLSPFGTTVAELFLAGDELLYLASSQNLAYYGHLNDLPDSPVLLGWRLLRWTAERAYPEAEGQKHLSRRLANGDREVIDFDSQGLVLKKRINGDEVRYGGYQSIDGVPVPTSIEITDRIGVSVRITLDEPEVNAPLDENAFVPLLDGVTVLPMSQFPTS